MLPGVEIAPLPDCRRSSSTAVCGSRRALLSGKIRIVDAQRFRRTEAGICLITQTMLDRLE